MGFASKEMEGRGYYKGGTVELVVAVDWQRLEDSQMSGGQEGTKAWRFADVRRTRRNQGLESRRCQEDKKEPRLGEPQMSGGQEGTKACGFADVRRTRGNLRFPLFLPTPSFSPSLKTASTPGYRREGGAGVRGLAFGGASWPSGARSTRPLAGGPDLWLCENDRRM
jgi:hypothetical protein